MKRRMLTVFFHGKPRSNHLFFNLSSFFRNIPLHTGHYSWNTSAIVVFLIHSFAGIFRHALIDPFHNNVGLIFQLRNFRVQLRAVGKTVTTSSGLA